MSRRGTVSSVVCGEAVWTALAEARPSGLTLIHLTMATKLGVSQVRRGVLYICEISGMQHASPLTWAHRGGYQLSVDPEDWIRYERAQFKAELTRVSRLLSGTVAPHLAARPNDEYAQLLMDQLTGMKAQLTTLNMLGSR
jgi:hypothetical protein